VAIGMISLAGAAAIAVLLPPERNFRAASGGLRATLATYAEHLRNPRLLATCGIGFGMLFCMVAMFTYANLYLAAPPYGLGPGQLGFVFVVNLLGLVTNPVATRLVLRVGRRATLALVVTLSTAGLLLTLSPLLPAVIAGMAATGGGLFVVQTLSLGFIAATIPRAKSTAVGLYVTCYYVGGALGGSVPALVWTRMGWPGVVGLLLPLLAAILALAWIFWREPRPGNVGFISR